MYARNYDQLPLRQDQPNPTARKFSISTTTKMSLQAFQTRFKQLVSDVTALPPNEVDQFASTYPLPLFPSPF